MRPTEDSEVARRFWAKVAQGPDCWERAGSPKNGYSWLAHRTSETWTYSYAHRFSYELHFGPIPSGLYVCHHCDNRRCVRPDHLFLGSHAENVADAARKGRLASKLTEADVREIRNRVAAGEPAARVSRSFGVHSTYAGRIIRGLAWAGRGLP